MSLETDIKQEKFTSEYSKLIINIAYTNAYLGTIFAGTLKPYDLSMQQFNVLRILRGQHPKPVSINNITDRMIDKMSNASRLVEKLRKKSMIERSKCEHDGRQVDVAITTKGLKVLAELDVIMEEYDKQFHHLSEEDAKTANEILDRLRDK
jgi:DNA-binding MarR family transcriptional regulator